MPEHERARTAPLPVLIVEDEEPAAQKLVKTLALAAPEAQVLAILTSVRETVAWLETHPAPAVLLLDIELADGPSFQLFEQTTVPCPVIFTTSYDAFALRAFKVNSVDYLLKPVQADELRAALDKLVWVRRLYRDGPDSEVEPLPPPALLRAELVQTRQADQRTAYRQRFLVQTSSQLLPVEVPQIAYFFTEDRLTCFCTTDGRKLVVEYSLDEVAAMLDPAAFFRVSRSFLVAVRSIAAIETYFGNRLALRLQPPTAHEVIVSRERTTAFKVWLGK